MGGYNTDLRLTNDSDLIKKTQTSPCYLIRSNDKKIDTGFGGVLPSRARSLRSLECVLMNTNNNIVLAYAETREGGCGLNHHLINTRLRIQ